MNQSIQERVGDGGVTDQLVPLAHRELARDHDRSAPHAVIQDLQQIPILFCRRSRDAEIVNDQEARA